VTGVQTCALPISGNVFMWSGGWVALSTYHLPGWDCAATSFTGTYSHN
jgi:hypothetical protein